MSAFHLRPATATKAGRIREIIRLVRINPMSLDWRRFILAVDEHDQIIGCGQIKPHGDGSYELASIAVLPEWREQGVARRIIEHLSAAHPGPLYLTCRKPLGSLYQKFGFRPLSKDDMPPYFQRLSRLANWVVRLNLDQDGMLVMKRD